MSELEQQVVDLEEEVKGFKAMLSSLPILSCCSPLEYN